MQNCNSIDLLDSKIFIKMCACECVCVCASVYACVCVFCMDEKTNKLFWPQLLVLLLHFRRKAVLIKRALVEVCMCVRACVCVCVLCVCVCVCLCVCVYVCVCVCVCLYRILVPP